MNKSEQVWQDQALGGRRSGMPSEKFKQAHVVGASVCRSPHANKFE